MDNELDLVVFEDDDGNELTMEVLDYLFYEGKEYALLTEYNEDGYDEDEALEAFVMEVRPLEDDDENEEFVPVDEALAARLMEIFENSGFDDAMDDDFDDDADE